MTSGKAAGVDQWVQFLVLRRQGESIRQAALKSGVNYYSARDAVRGRAPKNYTIAEEQVSRIGVSKIPAYEELPPEVAECWDSIEKFALRYFGIVLMPWQIEVAETVEELLASPHEEYLVSNAPPGSGKSTFFSKILPAWVTVKNRAIRGSIGSHTQRISEWYTRRLRAEFEREHVARAELNQARLGLQFDAERTLQQDFGAFRPDAKELWRASEFTVLQPDDQPLSQKEPTWSAFGIDSGFLGARYDIAIWDDAWDPRKMRNMEAREEFYKWWDEVAETRLEPGGLLVLNMQRMASDDISRYCLDKEAPADEEGSGVEDDGMVPEEISGQGFPLGNARNAEGSFPSETPSTPPDPDTPHTVEKKYRHLCYRAHYENLCEGNHRLDTDPWPNGCLLSPRRLPWRKLKQIKAQSPDRYAILYQQEDTDPASVLVDPIWISGGVGRDGVDHIGCWDNDRDLWELPPYLPSPPLIIASADPSPTNFWALQAWAFVEDTGFRYLLECYRRKMDAPSFLDWNQDTQRFSGVAEDWWQISNERGIPIRYWIVEVNAAQKFILQYDHFRRWAAIRGVELIPHQTHRNKGDSQYGVQMLAPLYKQGKIRLPGKQRTAARPHSLLLVNEVTKWNPEGTGSRTDDEVMAQWFVEYNLERLWTPSIENMKRQWRPSWLRDEGAA